MSNWIKNKILIKHNDPNKIDNCLSKIQKTSDINKLNFFCSAFEPDTVNDYYKDNPLKGWRTEDNIITNLTKVMKKNNIPEGTEDTPPEIQKKILEELSATTFSWGDFSWGCKYEHGFTKEEIEVVNDNEILLKSIKTCSTPPILILKKLLNEGYEIKDIFEDENNNLNGTIIGNKEGLNISYKV